MRRYSRRLINLLKRPFNASSFFSGLFGGSYASTNYWQSQNGTTPATAAGNTIGRVDDKHTTTEVFTAFYVSNFSAGVDGWAGTNGTAAGNIDAILGRDDCLRLTAGGAGGTTALSKGGVYYGATRNKTVISVYVPAAQAFADGFRIFGGTAVIYDGDGQNGSWVDVDVTNWVDTTGIAVHMRIGASSTLSASATGTLMYMRAITTSYTNLLHWYQANSARRPVLGIYPSVLGGAGIRNRIRNNTMAGASVGIARSIGSITSASRTASTTVVVASTGHTVTVGDILTCTGASVADYNGVFAVSAVSAGVSYSYVVASSASDSATGFTISVVSQGVSPNNWGISTTNAQLTTSISAIATESDISYIDVRIAGLVTASRDCDVRLEGFSNIPALDGQNWQESVYLREIGGSQTNIASISLQTNTYTSVSAYVNTPWLAAVTCTTAALNTQRRSAGGTLSGGTIAFITPFIKITTATTGAVDFTIRIGLPQLERASAITNAQKRDNTEYNITESGRASIPIPYLSVDDYVSTGVPSFGSASLFADSGQSWTIGGVFQAFSGTTATLLAKAGVGADTTRTLQVYLAPNFTVIARGATSSPGINGADGLFHAWMLSWNGSTLTTRLDAGAAYTLTVGAAAIESQNITAGARADTAPTDYMTGFNLPLLMLDKAITKDQQDQWFAATKAIYGTV